MNTDFKLIFVYNANSGWLNDKIDIIHKTLSPKTYKCSLCTLTYGFWYMEQPWKDFIQSLDVEVGFLHRDNLIKQFGVSDVPLPAAFKQQGKDIQLWIGADEMNQCKTLDDLIELVQKHFSKESQEGQ